MHNNNAGGVFTPNDIGGDADGGKAERDQHANAADHIHTLTKQLGCEMDSTLAFKSEPVEVSFMVGWYIMDW